GFLQATIVRGRAGTAMRPFGHGAQGVDDLSEQDIDDIVAYIRRWSKEPGLPITIPAELNVAGKDHARVAAEAPTSGKPASLHAASQRPGRRSSSAGAAAQAQGE
ncbi:MAG: hypothetical protein D6744_18705, partial [Planctomycetota bacterium]